MKGFSRRRRLLLAAACGSMVLPALAQDNKPLEWVIGYPPGGGSDAVARVLAVELSRLLARPVVVTNKPGASTNIAAEYVARAKDPANTMLTADFATLAANPHLFSRLPYDPERDFRPVGLLARFPMLLVVNPGVPARNYREFVEWAKSVPGGPSYGSAGVGSPHHLVAELFRERSGLKLQHVPYKGAAPAVQDLVGGQVPMAFMDSAIVQQYVANGRLRALAVASARRVPAFADVPTLAELGLTGFEAYAWQGLVAPAGMPQANAAALSRALQSALAAPAVKERFDSLSLEALPGTPEQMAAYVKSERERWGQLIRTNNIKLD